MKLPFQEPGPGAWTGQYASLRGHGLPSLQLSGHDCQHSWGISIKMSSPGFCWQFHPVWDFPRMCRRWIIGPSRVRCQHYPPLSPTPNYFSCSFLLPTELRSCKHDAIESNQSVGDMITWLLEIVFDRVHHMRDTDMRKRVTVTSSHHNFVFTSPIMKKMMSMSKIMQSTSNWIWVSSHRMF